MTIFLFAQQFESLSGRGLSYRRCFARIFHYRMDFNRQESKEKHELQAAGTTP